MASVACGAAILLGGGLVLDISDPYARLPFYGTTLLGLPVWLLAVLILLAANGDAVRRFSLRHRSGEYRLELPGHSLWAVNLGLPPLMLIGFHLLRTFAVR